MPFSPKLLLFVSLVLWGCATTSHRREKIDPAATPSRDGAGSAEALEPRDLGDCLAHLKQAHALVRSDTDRAKTLAALQRLTTTIRALRQQELDEPEAFASCEQKADTVLRGAAGSWTKPADSGRPLAKETLEQVASVYRLYLETFPAGQAAYRFSFFHAQVLFQLQRWAAAGTAYGQIVKTAVPEGELDRRLEAGLAAVLAWKRAFAAVSNDGNKKRAAWPAEGSRLVAAIEAFLQIAPNTPERVRLLFSQARAYYRFGRFGEAVRIFGEIATRHPRHELAQLAARLLLDALNAQRKHDEMRTWVKQLLAIQALARGELLAHLRAVDRGLQAMAAEALSREKKYQQCGEAYARLMRDFPRDPQWEVAAFNGAVCFENARLPSRALALRKQLVSRDPKSPLARKVLAHICARPEGKRVRWWRQRCR